MLEYIYFINICYKDEMFIRALIYIIICARDLPLAVKPSFDGVQRANGLVQRKDQHVEENKEVV